LEQQLFITAFYCYLNYHTTNDFVIDLDDVWRWLGFSTKQKFLLLLEKNFEINKDYKRLLNSQVKKDCEEKKHGGHNKELFMLNIKTFKLICIKADTKKAREIHEYYIKLEELLYEVIEEESNELKLQLENKDKQLKEKDDENKLLTNELEKTELIPNIYIYNIDTTKKNPELKIGFSKNVHNRIKPYKQVCKYGKIELSIPVPFLDIKIVESYIHLLLSKFKVKDEVFQLDVEEAKLIILNIINHINIINISNVSDRQLKLSKCYDVQSQILNNQSTIHTKISTNEISTQTDFNEDEPLSKPIIFEDNQLNNNFNEFVEKFCVVRNDVEVNSKDIIGKYRLWSKNTKKEVTIAFKNFLDTKFKYCRLQYQDKNQVVNGYTGIKLKDIEYKKSLNKTDAETFIFEKCIFTPGGTILKNTLLDEYITWKKNIGKDINNTEMDEILNYLKLNENVLYSTVWTSQGSGQGYYGLLLKSDEKEYKKPSTTSKKVYKREAKTNELLGTWDTIAKAAESENISAAKMSRSVKNKTVFNDDYYYSVQ
jgi:phage anti-repressor protein